MLDTTFLRFVAIWLITNSLSGFGNGHRRTTGQFAFLHAVGIRSCPFV